MSEEKNASQVLTAEEISESQKSFEIIRQEEEKLEKMGFKFTILIDTPKYPFPKWMLDLLKGHPKEA